MADRFRLLLSPPGVLVLWGGLALAVQRWASIDDGIDEGYAVDAASYLVIADAAPSLPDEAVVVRPFAERFPVHWLVGSVSELTSIPLEDVYRAASLLTVVGALAATHLALEQLRLDARAYAIALGALAASAYPLHYLLAAPGMLSDGVFVLGLALVLLGFARGSFPLVLGGLVVGLLGRQTAVPVAVVAAAWLAAAPGLRAGRVVRAMSALAVPAVVYLVVRTVADGFAIPRATRWDDSTLVGYLDSVGELGEHLGRIVLGIAVPAALVLGAWLRTRRSLPWGPLLAAAVVVVQPLVLGPATNGNNEPRLAGLAAPALAVAAAGLLVRAGLSRAEAVILGAAIALAGLHPRYTWPLPGSSGVWAAIELIAAAVAVAVLARPRARAGTA
jgi:hypothetical protein